MLPAWVVPGAKCKWNSPSSLNPLTVTVSSVKAGKVTVTFDRDPTAFKVVPASQIGGKGRLQPSKPLRPRDERVEAARLQEAKEREDADRQQKQREMEELAEQERQRKVEELRRWRLEESEREEQERSLAEQRAEEKRQRREAREKEERESRKEEESWAQLQRVAREKERTRQVVLHRWDFSLKILSCLFFCTKGACFPWIRVTLLDPQADRNSRFIPSWVTLGAKCIWTSQSTQKRLRVTVSAVDPQHVTVTFDEDPKAGTFQFTFSGGGICGVPEAFKVVPLSSLVEGGNLQPS